MTRPLTVKQVTAWEAAFQVTLTDVERYLLTTDAELLAPIGRQQQFVLIGYLRPMECPACHLPTPPRQALGRPVDWGSTSDDDTYRCPGCRRRLTRVMPFVGAESWRLSRRLLPASDDELLRDDELTRAEQCDAETARVSVRHRGTARGQRAETR